MKTRAEIQRLQETQMQVQATRSAAALHRRERQRMNFVTYFDRARPWWFCVVIATGPGTKPTPDGGPWATEYEVPIDERHRLSECSRTAERMLFRMLREHAPNVYTRAINLGWKKR